MYIYIYIHNIHKRTLKELKWNYPIMEEQRHYYIPQLNKHNKKPGDRNVLSPSVLLASEVPQAPLLLPVLLANLRTLLLKSPHTMSHRKWKNQPDPDLGASSILTSLHTSGRCYIQCRRRTAGISLTQLRTLRTTNDWPGKAWPLAHNGEKVGGKQSLSDWI